MLAKGIQGQKMGSGDLFGGGKNCGILGHKGSGLLYGVKGGGGMMIYLWCYFLQKVPVHDTFAFSGLHQRVPPVHRVLQSSSILGSRPCCRTGLQYLKRRDTVACSAHVLQFALGGVSAQRGHSAQ